MGFETGGLPLSVAQLAIRIDLIDGLVIAAVAILDLSA
jgi:hypothetical protein